ncbi:G5 domain-containing protein [Sporosarcina koreensis]|uniref:G5 domain-containing protein n=1 Tax=Sporosarcina koreensis TaxID=334735 RepID=UPI000590ABAD|nr:G5 domain-containing protein [Sporosarcina koreensis]
MGNRRIINYFISIAGVSLLLFGIASTGSFAADQFLFGKRFGAHTYAGPFDLSNRTSRDAEIKLTSDLLGMQDNLQADLVYQDAKIPLPAELVTYDSSATVDRAQTEAENPLVASVSEDGLRALLAQELPMLQFSDSEVASIAQGISDKLSSGIMPQSVQLTEYLETTQPAVTVASADVPTDGFSQQMLDVLDALDGVQLEPKEPFSLLAFIEETETGLLSDDKMTILASALYEAALRTNFWVEERTIRTELLDGVKPGFEAAIDRQLGLDFVLTNPNQTSYAIRSNWSGGALHVEYAGLPLRYAYEPYVAETNKYEPKTTVHYNKDLAAGRVDLLTEGRDGSEVIVQRKILEDGGLLTVEPVSEDFYPPVSRVEEHALARPETETPDSGGTDTGTPGSSADGGSSSPNDSSPDGNSSDGSGTDNTQNNEPGKPGTDGNNDGNSGSPGNRKPSSGNPDDQVGSINGKPSAKPQGDGHVYDKGGNLIK